MVKSFINYLHLIHTIRFIFTSPHKQPSQKHLFCYIYMYRTLTNPKLLRCLPHCRIIFYYISCDLNGPLLDIIFHKYSPANIFLQCMQRDFGVCLIKLSPETSHSVLPASLFYFLSQFSRKFHFNFFNNYCSLILIIFQFPQFHL